MPEINLIAIIGQKGVGKTTLANQLKDWKKTSFAEPIKAMLCELLAFQNVSYSTIQEMIYGSLKEIPTIYLNNRTPRHAMQTLGTEWRDLIHKELWLDIWERNLDKNQKTIIDDMRFIHEAKRIQNLGGKLVKIIRPDLITTTDLHPSEQEQSQIIPDFVIINSSDPLFMFDQFISWIERINKQ